MRPFHRALALIALTAIGLAACSPPRPKELSLEQRTVVDDERRLQYVVHSNWIPMHGTAKCVLDGSVLSIHVYSLIGAKTDFVEDLPDSLDPQLDEWARHDYLVTKDKEVDDTTVGGLPARVLRFETRARKEDSPGSLVFWVVRNKTYLYVFRSSFRHDARPEALVEVRTMLDSVAFLPPPSDEGAAEGDATITIR